MAHQQNYERTKKYVNYWWRWDDQLEKFIYIHLQTQETDRHRYGETHTHRERDTQIHTHTQKNSNNNTETEVQTDIPGQGLVCISTLKIRQESNFHKTSTVSEKNQNLLAICAEFF